MEFLSANNFEVLKRARDNWATIELPNYIGQYLNKQFKELQNDLAFKGGKGRHLGLLDSLLRAFFTHVIQTAKAQKEPEYVAQVKTKAKDIREVQNELYTLWAQVRKQDDPEELGRQAARYFERMRGQQACDVALREIRLHRPSRQPVNITISADDNQQVFNMKEHTFIAGNSESLSHMSKHLQTRYKLNILKRDLGADSSFVNHKDAFSAVASLCWSQKNLCTAAGLPDSADDIYTERQREEAVAKISVHLRALAVRRMEKHFKDGHTAKCSAAIGQDMNEYVKNVKTTEYPGDLFCLWALAQEISSNIRVWLPGDKRCIFIGGSENRKAYNMVIARDADSMAIDGSRAHAETLFLPVLKYKDSLRKSLTISEAENKVVEIAAVGRMAPTPPRMSNAARKRPM